MPESRVQLTVEIETEGAEQLTSLRRELEQLGQTGAGAVGELDSSFTELLGRLQQSRQLVGQTTQTFAQSHRQLFASLEPLFQGFFNRLLAGARGFRDAFRRLLADLLGFFLRTVEEMVAGWLGGLRQMSGGGLGGGFFGLLAPLVSSGFGLAAGPRGTPPTFPTGGTSAGGLSDIFRRLGIELRDLGFVPGSALFSGGLLATLLGFTRGSRVLGALGGAAAGFALGGPIGALIGGVAGFFAGLFGRGRLKRKAAQSEAALFAQLKQVVEDFKQFRLDFETALASFDALWADFQASAPRQFGFAGRRAVANVAPYVAILRRQLVELQRAREERQKLIESLPIPEFQLGGLVGALRSQNGRLLAFLHAGEAVLNPRAVQALGPAFIERVNRAPSFSAGGMATPSPITGHRPPLTINIYQQPGEDSEALARRVALYLNRWALDRGHPSVL